MGLVTVDGVAGWVRFDDVGSYLSGDRCGLVPYDQDASGFFDSVKKWAAGVAKKAKAFGKKIQGVANTVLNNSIVDQAKTWLSTIPGYGTVISSALGAAQSLAKGKSLKDVALDAAQSAIPGGLGKTIFGAARGVLDAALSKGNKGKAILGAAAKVGADLLLDKLKSSPALKALATKQLAQVSGVEDEEAQLAQAALFRQLAPEAPAFPAGVSIDDGAALLGSAGQSADYDNMRSVIEPPRALSLTAELALMQLVPALRRADERLRRLVVRGSLVGEGGNGGDAAGLVGGKYVVEAGDYGAKIVAKLGHPGEVQALVAANPGVVWTKLQPGQELELPPGWGGSPAPAPAPAPNPGPVGPSNVPSGASGRTYTVVAGDYGGKIASKFGKGPAAVPELVAANPQVKDWQALQPGQELNIPASWPALGGGEAPPAPAPAPMPYDPPLDPLPIPEEYSIPLPEIVDPYGNTPTPPDGMIPPPPFDQIPPPGTDEDPSFPLPLPGTGGPWIPTAAHIARAQAILAAWATKYPTRATPSDYGKVQGDLSATWTTRSAAICRSYQAWANMMGAALRTDGELDKPTYTSLENTLVDLVKMTPVPSPVPSGQGGAGFAPAKSGGGLGLLLPLAAAVFF